MKTFGIEVRFTPAYHAATNGAIERRHQTIKNSLKAVLVDMGDTHGSQWMRALPWVMLGKRVQVQPDLDVSAAELCYGKTLDLPGHFLTNPGEPLSNLQTRVLVEELYKMNARPAMQTSATVNPIDISYTEKATHVYIKKETHLGLTPLFEGPYKIISRPSRSQIEVRVGSFADGRPRLQIYNWSQAKIAHLRSDNVEASRPNLGRKPRPDPPTSQTTLTTNTASDDAAGFPPLSEDAAGPSVQQAAKPAQIQTEPNYSVRNTRITRNPNPQYT